MLYTFGAVLRRTFSDKFTVTLRKIVAMLSHYRANKTTAFSFRFVYEAAGSYN